MDSSAEHSRGRTKTKTLLESPSANWFALQKKISNTSRKCSKGPPRKKRKVESSVEGDGVSEVGSSTRGADNDPASLGFPRGYAKAVHTKPPDASASASGSRLNTDGSESLDYLREMVFGQVEYSASQKLPGKYLAIDCEMVGIGIDGAESSLARVSLVNYHGAVIVDEFVRQRERVVDYRTMVSGVRETNMIKAKPFVEIQKQIALLLKDRILVGHAVYNDLKALLLSHPRPLTRDTQLCAGKARLLKTKYPALRKLAKQELGITIQAGEHSSVTDARATMALYRFHRKEWEKGFRSIVAPITCKSQDKKRKAPSEDDEEQAEKAPQDRVSGKSRPKKGSTPVIASKGEEFPGGGRRGVSSGLSRVVKRAGERTKNGKIGTASSKRASGGGAAKWWKTLVGVSAVSSGRSGSKGSMRIS